MARTATATKPAPRKAPADPMELWSSMELRRLETTPVEVHICDSRTLITFYTELLAGSRGGALAPGSDGLGPGSVFTIELPVDGHGTDGTGGTRKRKGAAPGPPIRILVVDDNRDSADSLGMLFRLVGHDVRTAHDGLEAIAAADEFRPDAIVLDIGLPKLDGHEVARQLRRLEWCRKTILIAVTGWGQEEDKERSVEAGFDHHLVKPVDPSALLDLLAGRG